jgi:hypothetical protein
LVLLATAGTGLVTYLGQTAHTLRQLRQKERLTLEASAQLERLVLWDRSALLGRIGRTRLGEWVLIISEATPDLFEVAIAESDSSVAMLRTTLYRPATNDAPQP